MTTSNNSSFFQKVISTMFPKGYVKSKRDAQSIQIEGDHLVFVGGSKYQAISADLIESITYQPRAEVWQEVKIKQVKKEPFNYYLRSDPESLTNSVKVANQQLKPAQPICQFILSAKQGGLTGRD